MRRGLAFSASFWTALACLVYAGYGNQPPQQQRDKPAGAALAGAVKPAKKMTLWNGKDFSGWKLFVPSDTIDARTVWTVKENVIHCTGVPNGYMRTEANYADYKLHLEWRWPAEAGNSGVLLHMSAPDTVWPKSIECQLAAGDAGDFWVIGGTDFKEHADKSKRRLAKKAESSEKPLGEWNTYEIICRSNTIRSFVNGVLQNEATETTVNSGKICLQSEGKPIEFRNIYVEPVK
jgi:hypothetical protein